MDDRPPPVPKHSIPVDHALTAENRLVANDLTHGNGMMRLALSREWSRYSLNAHFGPRWSDRNLVLLTLIDRDVLLIARFISIDPLIGNAGDTASHNAYSYALNNPLRYRDPMGTGSFEDEIANYNQECDYLMEADGKTPKTYTEGPFEGEPIVNRRSALSR
jgi:hypothetical protein